ncbi:MAG: hypothetical protein ACRDQF_12930 [Thermocrispum sp.]
MVFRRQAKSSGKDLVVVGQPGGVLVTGPPGAVESLVARFLEVAGPGVRSTVAAAADVMAVAAQAGALAATHGEYVRLTARSMDLLKNHDLLPKTGETITGVVRDPAGKIRGILDLEKVGGLGAEQALALQTAAATLALRAAIAEVQAAVERVEGKVDDLLGLLRADRVGDILGTRKVLDPLVDRSRHTGRVSTTDWQAVAALGAEIAKGIETLRAHIRSTLEAADGGWRPGERVEDAERLFERKGLLVESLALLIVAEHNLGAWHELRIAHVRLNEPEHLTWTLEDARAAVAAEIEYDQAIVDSLRAVADTLTKPQLHDGLAPWQRRELTEARSKLDDLAGWFAQQRVLDLAPLGEAPYPSAKESFRHVTRNVGDLAGRSFGSVRGRLGRGRRSGVPELPSADPPLS